VELDAGVSGREATAHLDGAFVPLLLPGRHLSPQLLGRGAFARSIAKAKAAEDVRAGRLRLLERAEAFREIEERLDYKPLADPDAYCALVKSPGCAGQAPRPSCAPT
jgi:hypothetical protein